MKDEVVFVAPYRAFRLFPARCSVPFEILAGPCLLRIDIDYNESAREVTLVIKDVEKHKEDNDDRHQSIQA